MGLPIRSSGDWNSLITGLAAVTEDERSMLERLFTRRLLERRWLSSSALVRCFSLRGRERPNELEASAE